ncbi:MAG: bifunctional folylpolyglutamate synthase/dihydrofolate synthase, partial [Planctomycetota bacterium]
GLGGRLDATSAVRPLASLITQIGLDHTAVLGRTRALIAREKAGVARRGVPLVSGVAPATAAGRVIAEVAAERGAPLLAAGRELRLATGRPAFSGGLSATPVRLRTSWGPGLSARPSLLGRDLARDAGLAAATLLVPRVARRLPVSEEQMADGLARLTVPGRVQVVPGEPLLVVDGAHNGDSARSLVRTLREALPHRRAVVVLGGGRDKMLEAVIRALAPLRPRFVFTRPASHPRAADPRELARGRRGSAWAVDLGSALERARGAAGPRDLVVVTGSLYLAGEALELLGIEGEGDSG